MTLIKLKFGRSAAGDLWQEEKTHHKKSTSKNVYCNLNQKKNTWISIQVHQSEKNPWKAKKHWSLDKNDYVNLLNIICVAILCLQMLNFFISIYPVVFLFRSYLISSVFKQFHMQGFSTLFLLIQHVYTYPLTYLVYISSNFKEEYSR